MTDAMRPRQITERDVRESVAVARSHGEKFFEQIVWQVENEAWMVLGYGSWDAMRAGEYGDMGVVAPRADRPELVARLKQRGMPNTTIAATLGVDETTVRRDLNRQMPNDGTPATITNSRGQERPTSYTRAPRPDEPMTRSEAERLTNDIRERVRGAQSDLYWMAVGLISNAVSPAEVVRPLLTLRRSMEVDQSLAPLAPMLLDPIIDEVLDPATLERLRPEFGGPEFEALTKEEVADVLAKMANAYTPNKNAAAELPLDDGTDNQSTR